MDKMKEIAPDIDIIGKAASSQQYINYGGNFTGQEINEAVGNEHLAGHKSTNARPGIVKY